MFKSLTLRGAAGAVLYKYHTAAALTSWTIAKQPDGCWHLTGTVSRADPFQCRQAVKDLHFTAPRANGLWCWEIVKLDVVGRQLRAQLGHPLQ